MTFKVLFLYASLVNFYLCKVVCFNYFDSNDIMKRMNYKFSLIQDWQPQQIHLSYGDNYDEMVITWVTINKTLQSIVHYGIGSFEMKAYSLPTKFVDGGKNSRVIWIHKVHLKNLLSNNTYIYRCGSNYGWSEIFKFQTMKEGTDSPIHFAIYGDLGVVNSVSLTRLQKETEQGLYDAVIHVGDFAYDLHTDDGLMGDAFMRNIQPIAAYVPYMVCPGNHEHNYNYKARFSMPSYEKNENMFYSWNIGPVHFIAVNTEAYYYLNYGIKPLIMLHKWLIADLEEATRPEIRKIRPWIILYGHRPMYCSNTDHDDCTHKFNLIRVGLPFMYWLGMEKILAKYGVDLAIWAHEHSYERLWPIYDFKILNGSIQRPYYNPKGPVHMITGSAGCQERHDSFVRDTPYWSAFHSSDYGYTRLYIKNKTHLHWEQVSDDQNGAVIDSVWLVRSDHEAYSHLL